MKVTMKHTYNCSAEDFFDKVFFEDHYNEALYREALSMETFEILEIDRKDDGGLTRTLKAEPKMNVPRVLKKVLGDGSGYTETGTFDPDERVWSFTITPAKMANKISISGKLWAEPIDEDTCERVCECDIKVKIFGIGGAMEKFIKSQFEDNYSKAADFTNDWIEEQDEL